MIALPTFTPVITLSMMETTDGSEEEKIHLPVEFDCGITGLVNFCVAATVKGLNAPRVGGVPITRTSNVVLVAV